MKTILMAALVGAIAAPAIAQDAMTQAQAEVRIRARLESYLKDPGSAQLKIDRTPVEGTVTTKNGAAHRGWLVCGQINAKNAYGGYVGFERYLFVVPAAGGDVAVLPRLTTDFANVDAYRAACVLNPPQVG